MRLTAGKTPFKDFVCVLITDEKEMSHLIGALAAGADALGGLVSENRHAVTLRMLSNELRQTTSGLWPDSKEQADG